MPEKLTVTEAVKLEKIARYKELIKYLWYCNIPKCDGQPHVGFPHRHARWNQRVGDAQITAFVTGRGWGKTRTAAEFVKQRMLSENDHRVIVIAPSFGAGRDICVEGESGILSIMPKDRIKRWNRSHGQLWLNNGSQLKIFGAHNREDAQSLRGPQSNTLWFEELAHIGGSRGSAQEAWDNANMGCRLGSDPRVVVTTTPKPTHLVKALLAHKYEGTEIIHGSTFDNRDNLAKPFLSMLVTTYQGTRLGEQELEGLLLDDVVGALWNRDMFESCEVDPKTMDRIVIAVDPPGSHRNGAEAGIVVVGKRDELAYVLQDASFLATPEQWSSKVVELYDSYNADSIIAERNYGGDMVETTLRGVDKKRNIKVKLVTSSRGKALRAEPIVNLYERGLVKHAGNVVDLEQQMCSWVPPGQTETDEHGVERPVEASDYSPDRVDALVFACTELMVQPRKAKTLMRFNSYK